jgi:hypothetical protein
MSVRSKALIETLKVMALWLAACVGVYFLLGILGPKLGMLLILVSMISWFGWLAYDYYVSKFTMEEKLKL